MRGAIEELEARLLLAGPSIVSVEPGGRRLFVQDRLSDGSLAPAAPIVMRGVNWSPHTPGADPANLAGEFANAYQADLPKIAAMGANVVRVYHDFGTGPVATQILDEFARRGLKVIVTVDSPRQGVVGDLANVSAVVSAYKNHPAILMWAVGNEWDLSRFGRYATLADAAAFVEQAAQLVKSIDANHPVTTFLADPHIPGIHPLSPDRFPFAQGRPYTSQIVNDLVPSVDVWGFNVYRNASFGDLFRQWQSISTEPMFVSEFGADSFDHRTGAQNEAMQASFDAGLWDEIYFDLSAERTSGVALGGLAFEFQDEWWKNGDPSTHDVSNEANGGQPDGVNDEEHFGLMTIGRTPKQAYSVLQSRFTNGQAAVELDASPVLRVESQGNAAGNSGVQLLLDGETWLLRQGGQFGGRGITVGVLDQTTGIRLSDVRTFDTWLSPGGFGGFHANFPPLLDYLAGLPDGAVVMLGVGDEAGFINPNSGQPWGDSETWYQAFEALGSTMVRQVGYRGGWAMIFRKGHGVLAEQVSPPNAPAAVEVEVNVVLDPDAGRRSGPIVLASSFDFDRPKPTVTISFSADVTGSVAGSDLQVVRLDNSQAVPGTAIAVSYDATLRRARFTFPGLPGGTLPDGNYRATLPAGAVADSVGTPSATAHVFDFYVLGGDANRDRAVNFNDLVVLAQNYNTSGGMTFSRGDFNYDGNVDFNDLVILAQRYNTTLPLPPPAAPAALVSKAKSASLFSTTSVTKAPVPLARPKPVIRARTQVR